MRTESWTILASLAMASAATQISSSQVLSETGSKPQSESSIAIVLKGMPYSATRIITTVQVTPDGKTVTRTDKSLLWRDAEGRTRQEDIDSPAARQTRAVNVNDPIAHVHFSWNAGDRLEKEVMVTEVPIPEHEQDVWPDSASVRVPQLQSSPSRPAVTAQQRDPNVTAEILPSTNINGVYVTGSRVNIVIPEGKEGNDHGIKITSESWKSPDLKVTVRLIRDDPRTGRTTMELTNIDRANPNPALFAPPDGYRMQDVTKVFYPGSTIQK